MKEGPSVTTKSSTVDRHPRAAADSTLGCARPPLVVRRDAGPSGTLLPEAGGRARASALPASLDQTCRSAEGVAERFAASGDPGPALRCSGQPKRVTNYKS
jgi:hypothetical protein